jgi:UDP-N-acetylmuramate dehydrogenase
LSQLTIENDVTLAPLTTLGIGGHARYFARAESEEQVVDAVAFAAEKGLDIFVIGGGSNVLISDNGFVGLTLQIAIKGIKVVDESAGKTTLTVSAGEDWDQFVEYCVRHDLAGVECLSGIPGLVGGTRSCRLWVRVSHEHIQHKRSRQIYCSECHIFADNRRGTACDIQGPYRTL